jgi:hydroxyethylthiazole kinase
MTADSIWEDISKIRKDGPLVHNITNYVVMNTTANALLAIGASPVMAHALEEVEEMAGLASALVLNIGTLSGPWIEAMLSAGNAANRKGIPVIFDPVGAGATTLRTDTAHKILQTVGPAIIRGNGSEIYALARAEGVTKGVDSTMGAEAALSAARELSAGLECTVSVSGDSDVIIRGDKTIKVRNGHPMMARVTGLGCTASALTGAFSAVNPDPLNAAAHAMAVLGIAGQIAAEDAEGPGTLQLNLLDVLYRLTRSQIAEHLRCEGDA